MDIREVQKIKDLIGKSEVENAKAQGVIEDIKSEWREKYGFDTVEEANCKYEELKENLSKMENREEKLMKDLSQIQDWEKIEEELN